MTQFNFKNKFWDKYELMWTVHNVLQTHKHSIYTKTKFELIINYKK